MTGFSARPHDRLLHLNEIADLGSFFKHGTRAQPRKRPNRTILPDTGPFNVAKGMNCRTFGNLGAGSKTHMRLDRHIAADLRIMAEPNR